VRGLAIAGAASSADRLAVERSNHETLVRRLARSSPALRLAGDRQRTDDHTRRAELAIAHQLATLQARLLGQQMRMTALHPERVLARGYAILTRLSDSRIVTTIGQVRPGEALGVQVSDGTFTAEVTGAIRPAATQETA